MKKIILWIIAILFLTSCTTYTIKNNTFEIWIERKLYQRWMETEDIFVLIDWYWYKKEDWFDVWKKVKYCVE
jgi:uncharacterized protein YxeA